MSFRIWLSIVILGSILACGPGSEPFIGKYEARDEAGKVIRMELSEGGRGIWIHEGETVEFFWAAREGSVSLHTRTGGVVQTRNQDGGLLVKLPGVGELVFKRP
ncbi:MAG: hypothetical protein EOM25_09995 [Deltaproteobacteria bacterium]|nr:hypothetical protein [Deltaproteobacteria bacterium]